MVIEPRRVFAFHLAIVAGLVLANAPIAIMDSFGHRGLFGYSRLLRMEEEANIPSLFSTIALIACAVVAYANRSQLEPGQPDRQAWSVLAAAFAFLALDESISLHEMANRIGADLALGGALRNVGVLVYVPIVILMAVLLGPFWLRQERRLQVTLFTGAALCVSGAIGMELVENSLLSAGFGYDDLPLRISVTVEETAEMLGVAVFLYAFLSHFSSLGGGVLVPLNVPARGEISRKSASSETKA